jgi:hypothetical protein
VAIRLVVGGCRIGIFFTAKNAQIAKTIAPTSKPRIANSIDAMVFAMLFAMLFAVFAVFAFQTAMSW